MKMSDPSQIEQIKGMLVGIEITIIGIAIVSWALVFGVPTIVVVGLLLTALGVIRTADEVELT